MKLALLSNVSAGVLERGLNRGHGVWTPPGFGAWMETALCPPPDLIRFAPDAFLLVLDGRFAAYAPPAALEAAGAVRKSFPGSRVLCYAVESLLSGRPGAYDRRMWDLYSMPWSADGIDAALEAIETDLVLMRGGMRKVAAVDFDGTLWQGVLGEDGPEGIRPYSRVQDILLQWRSRGIVLCGVTRNNPQDLAHVWERDGMSLKPDDFAFVEAGWGEKTESIRRLSSKLNLSTDSFVFIDDNPVERMRVKSEMPEVATPCFDFDGETGAVWNLMRIAETCFSSGNATYEDSRRAQMYADESKRREFASGRTFDEYLAGLKISLDVHEMREDEAERVAQLSGRTNQFNVLAVRRDAASLLEMLRDAGCVMATARVSDIFGDMGLVAFASARISGSVAHIEDWMMSCRAMNRRIEFGIEREFERILASRGIREIRAVWRRTGKNAPVENLFENFGFTATAVKPDGKDYLKSLQAE